MVRFWILKFSKEGGNLGGGVPIEWVQEATMTPIPDPFDVDVPEPGAGRVVLHDTPWVLLLFPETRSIVWVDLTRLPHTSVPQETAGEPGDTPTKG